MSRRAGRGEAGVRGPGRARSMARGRRGNGGQGGSGADQRPVALGVGPEPPLGLGGGGLVADGPEPGRRPGPEGGEAAFFQVQGPDLAPVRIDHQQPPAVHGQVAGAGGRRRRHRGRQPADGHLPEAGRFRHIKASGAGVPGHGQDPLAPAESLSRSKRLGGDPADAPVHVHRNDGQRDGARFPGIAQLDHRSRPFRNHGIAGPHHGDVNRRCERGAHPVLSRIHRLHQANRQVRPRRKFHAARRRGNRSGRRRSRRRRGGIRALEGRAVRNGPAPARAASLPPGRYRRGPEPDRSSCWNCRSGAVSAAHPRIGRRRRRKRRAAQRRPVAIGG